MRNLFAFDRYEEELLDFNMLAYFDTNVFDHLQQRSNGVTEEDLFRLGRAVKLNHLRVVISFLAIEETLLLIPHNPKRADARMKLILELGDKRLFALGQEIIVNNDIQAYAHGTPSLSAFTLMNPQTELNIRNLAKPAGNYLTELQDLIEEVRRDKIAFLDFLDEGKAKVKPIADQIGVKRYRFELYWANNSGWLAEGLADRAGVLSKVKQRGMDGLLKVKSVAMAVGANLSLIYSHHLENRAPKPGDSRDILHAIVASTADVFVTDDESLEKTLARIPVAGFKVMSPRTFLKTMPTWI